MLEPTKCQILQVPLQVDVELCEHPGQKLTIIFPNCTLLAEFDSSGIDDVEATLNMASLGSDTVKLSDGTDVTTDMYVKLTNNMPEIGGQVSP